MYIKMVRKERIERPIQQPKLDHPTIKVIYGTQAIREIDTAPLKGTKEFDNLPFCNFQLVDGENFISRLRILMSTLIKAV